MEVICENCEAKLNIPDDKIPKGQRVTFNCPKCKNKLIIDTAESEEEKAVPEAENKTLPVSSGKSDVSENEEDSDLDFYDEGAKLALVLGSDPKDFEKLKKAIKALGFKYVTADNTRAAIEKMRFHHYDLVILFDGFDGIGAAHSPVSLHLHNLPMSVRRRLFFVLIGDSFKTMDHMRAFASSVNLVVNPKDLDKLGGILRSSLLDHDKFYKVFFDVLKEAGKD